MQPFTTLKIATLSALIATGGIGATQAVAGGLGKDVHKAGVEISDGVSKHEAKSLVKDYLKENGRKKLRPGKISKSRLLEGSEYRDKWKVDIQSLNRIPVGMVYVDAETGEITTKK